MSTSINPLSHWTVNSEFNVIISVPIYRETKSLLHKTLTAIYQSIQSSPHKILLLLVVDGRTPCLETIEYVCEWMELDSQLLEEKIALGPLGTMPKISYTCQKDPIPICFVVLNENGGLRGVRTLTWYWLYSCSYKGLLVMCDSDTVLSPGCLDGLVDSVSSSPLIMAAGARLIPSGSSGFLHWIQDFQLWQNTSRHQVTPTTWIMGALWCIPAKALGPLLEHYSQPLKVSDIAQYHLHVCGEDRLMTAILNQLGQTILVPQSIASTEMPCQWSVWRKQQRRWFAGASRFPNNTNQESMFILFIMLLLLPKQIALLWPFLVILMAFILQSNSITNISYFCIACCWTLFWIRQMILYPILFVIYATLRLMNSPLAVLAWDMVLPITLWITPLDHLLYFDDRQWGTRSVQTESLSQKELGSSRETSLPIFKYAESRTRYKQFIAFLFQTLFPYFMFLCISFIPFK